VSPREAELRGVLTAILELGMIGRLHPEARVESASEARLLTALGRIAGLATVALEETTLPPFNLPEA
jgi:hypothetical protein